MQGRKVPSWWLNIWVTEPGLEPTTHPYGRQRANTLGQPAIDVQKVSKIFIKAAKFLTGFFVFLLVGYIIIIM